MPKLTYTGTPIELFVAKQLDRICKEKEDSTKSAELETGFKDLDDLLLGLHGGYLYLLASKPSVGKTAFLINILLNITQEGKKALFVTPTMASSQVAQRMLSCVIGIKMEHIFNGALEKTDEEILRKFIKEEKAIQSNFICLDYPLPTVEGIKEYLYSLPENERPEIVVIDDLSELCYTKKWQRREASTHFMHESLNLAKEFNIPVLISAELKKAPKKKGTKMVQLRDLKKYGLSEQYASVIMFLFRPEYYQKDMDGAFTTKGETHLRIAKNDMGPLDTVKLQADLGIQRFSKFEITEEL